MRSDRPDNLSRPAVQPERYDDRLVRLIEHSFAFDRAVSFREAFHAFAETYFAVAMLEDGPFRRQALQAPAVEALAGAFSAAVRRGDLPCLPYPARLMALTALTNLATLEQEIRGGALSSTEAALVCTTMLFEGLQASPVPAAR